MSSTTSKKSKCSLLWYNTMHSRRKQDIRGGIEEGGKYKKLAETAEMTLFKLKGAAMSEWNHGIAFIDDFYFILLSHSLLGRFAT